MAPELEGTTLLNVCLRPDPEVSDSCIELSQSLESEDTAFVLGADKFAHMTVFMARFADAEVEYVLEAVAKAVKGFQTFEVQHNGYLLTEGGYLEASYRRGPDLMALHEILASALAGMRFNPGKPHIEGYFAPYSSAQQRNAEKTGYDLAYDLYRPHITLTRYKEEQMPQVFPALAAAELSFQAQEISVYKADDNGAVYQLLEQFVIGDS